MTALRCEGCGDVYVDRIPHWMVSVNCPIHNPSHPLFNSHRDSTMTTFTPGSPAPTRPSTPSLDAMYEKTNPGMTRYVVTAGSLQDNALAAYDCLIAGVANGDSKTDVSDAAAESVLPADVATARQYLVDETAWSSYVNSGEAPGVSAAHEGSASETPAPAAAPAPVPVPAATGSAASKPEATASAAAAPVASTAAGKVTVHIEGVSRLHVMLDNVEHTVEQDAKAAWSDIIREYRRIFPREAPAA